MTRELDADDLKVIDAAHVKIAEQTIEGMIGGIIRVGGNVNDLMALLESVNSAIMVYLDGVVPDFDLVLITSLLMENTIQRVTDAKKAKLPN